MHERTTSGADGTGAQGRRKGTPLRRQLLVLLFVFAVCPLLLSNLWGYLQTRQRLTEAAYRDVRNAAMLQASHARQSIEEKQRLLPSIVAGNRHLFTLMQLAQTCSMADACQAVEQRLTDHLRAKADENNSVMELAVLSTGSTVVASSLRTRETSTIFVDRCRQAAREAQLEYHEGEPLILLSADVRDQQGAVLGLLCARFLFDVHEFLVATSEHQTASATSYLVDELGQVLCSSIPHNEGAGIGHEVEQHQALPPVGGEPWHGRYHVDASDHDHRSADHSHGTEVLAAYEPIAAYGWGVLVEAPVEQALANLEQLKWQAVIFGLLLSLGLLVVASFAARRMSRPLVELSHAAQRAAEGKLGETLDPTGPQEVADSTRAFNRMSLSLKESHEQLEERIAERTQELQRSREFLELILNAIEQRVLVVGREGEILRANAAALEMHGADIVGRSYSDVVEEVAAKGEAPYVSTLESGTPSSSERLQVVRDRKEIVWLETFPVASAGHVEAVVEIGRIVTHEKRLEAQMLHQEKMATFGLLAAGIAHDIGNPLASILAQLRMTRETDDVGRTTETLEIVEREVERIARLLRDLVMFARRKRDRVVRLDVNSVARDVERLLAHDPRARNVEIRMELQKGLPAIRAAEDRVMQILLNLGVNALDAMDGEGTVSFCTAEEAGAVVVRVRDTGPGVDEEVAGRLFEPFVTTKPPGKGTGLGLFVSRGVAEGLGGTLEMEGNASTGTTFALRLPGEPRAQAESRP